MQICVTTKGKKDEKDIRTSYVVPDTRGWAQSQTDGDLRHWHGFIRKSRMRRTSRTGQSLYSAALNGFCLVVPHVRRRT